MKPSEKAEFIKLKDRISALEEWVANRDEDVTEPEAVEPESPVEEAPVQQEPKADKPKRKAKPKKKA